MRENIRYCASSFLMYRFVVDPEYCFSKLYPPAPLTFPIDRTPVRNGEELLEALRLHIEKYTCGKKCALALSGGIDSAILLALAPKGTVAYTFRCIVPGKKVTDEYDAAEAYIRWKRPDIEHKEVPVYWEDFEQYAPLLMRHKGSPTHSIEIQIYKAARLAKEDGCDIMLFGETADCLYGGHSKLLSRDWTREEFIRRWSFLMPDRALKDPEIITAPYDPYVKEDGKVDVPEFLARFESLPSLNFYRNACDTAGMELLAPYAHTFRNTPLDMDRVRRENKYIVREAFYELFPGFSVPEKTPMPRAMNEWLENWTGPDDPLFLPGCTESMNGDEKWLIWALDRYLKMIKEE